jgi:RimJ/RimL family protein N-acetyltransferase
MAHLVEQEGFELVIRSSNSFRPRISEERRIFAECRPQNVASWRLLTKVGFRADGLAGARSGRKRLVLDAAEPDASDGAELR